MMGPPGLYGNGVSVGSKGPPGLTVIGVDDAGIIGPPGL